MSLFYVIFIYETKLDGNSRTLGTQAKRYKQDKNYFYVIIFYACIYFFPSAPATSYSNTKISIQRVYKVLSGDVSTSFVSSFSAPMAKFSMKMENLDETIK